MPFASLSGDPSFTFPEFTDPPATPMAAARAWLATADDISEPLSMTLATAADGVVSARTVDVKRLDDEGLVFGSSTESPKGRQLTANPAAALQVYWRETMQQMRFEGVVVVLPDDESDALFTDRAPRSRAATAAARQSEPLDGTFDDLLSAARALGDDAGRPASWVAYRLEPVVVEFWHGSRDRMHRRLQYRRSDAGWTTRVLQP